MISQQCANLKALQVAPDLRQDILGLDPDIVNAWVQCYPDTPATMTITLSTLETDIVNMDYIQCLPKRTARKLTTLEPPHFFTPATLKLLNRVEERIRYYGGKRANSAIESEDADFFFYYTGPLLHDSDVSLAIKAAAKRAGMTGASFMKFWRRHSWKIQDDVRPYTETVLFPFWY